LNLFKAKGKPYKALFHYFYMIIPVRCFSCGKPIAQLYNEYKKMVGEGKNHKDAMDELGIERYCCRAQFLGQTDTLELVNKFKKF